MQSSFRHWHESVSATLRAAIAGWIPPSTVMLMLLLALSPVGLTEVRALLAARDAARLPNAEHTPSMDARAPAAMPAIALDALTASSLFGHYDSGAPETADASRTPAVPADAAPGDLPEATLGVSLRGVVFADDAKARRAIVDDGNGPVDDYRIGDRLPGDAVIRGIEPRRIVIEHAGRWLAVSLQEPAGATAPGFRAGAGLSEATAEAVPPLPESELR